MEFKNGYKLIYQKAKELYASKKSIPMADDAIIDTGLTEEEKSRLKLVYETKDSIIVNFTGLPTAEDKPIVLTADGEPVVGPSGDEPTPITMVPFEVGQKITGFYFGNVKNGDINEELESFLLAAPTEKETVFVGGANRETGFGMLILYHMIDEEMGELAFIGYSADGSGIMPTALYSTRDVDFEGLQLTRGYQNLTDGCYKCPLFVAEVVSYNIEDTSWNGKFIGAVKYEGSVDGGSDDGSSSVPDEPSDPTPTVKPFVDGAAWVEGSRIWFNSSADWEALLSAALGSGKTDGGSDITINPLFEISSEDPGNDISCPYFSKVSLDEGTDAYIIQAYETGTSEDDPTLIKYCSTAVPQYEVAQGFQNLDSDNAYTPTNYGTNRTIYINKNVDQLGIDWNGTMIGIIEE